MGNEIGSVEYPNQESPSNNDILFELAQSMALALEIDSRSNMALHLQVSEVGDVSHRMVNDIITENTAAILNQENLSSNDKKTISDLQSHEFIAKT